MRVKRTADLDWECTDCGAIYFAMEDAELCCTPDPVLESAIQNIQIGGDHYKSKSIQPWDAMEAWMPRDQFIGFLRGNAIKYLARAGSKGPDVVDYKKAGHYIDKLIEVLEND